MHAVALVALKDLVQAKSRLSGLLSPSERRALAQAMAEDVLAQLVSHPGIKRVLLVSDDPGAPMMSQMYAAEFCPESSLGCNGLNNLLTEACARLPAVDQQQVLIVHADVPLISRQELSTAMELQCNSGGIVIGTDRRGEGTNMLVFDGTCFSGFSFGEGSRFRHEAMARKNGLVYSVLDSSGVGLDVDEPEDLAALLQALPTFAAEEGIAPEHQEPPIVGQKTAAMLQESGVDERIRVALPSGQDYPGDNAQRGPGYARDDAR